MPTKNRAQMLSSLNRAARQYAAGWSIASLAVAQKLGLLPTDLQLLNLLALYGAATPGSLARYTGLSSGGVTVALDRLERAGAIRRRANPADRRSLLISIRPAQARRIAAKNRSAQAGFHAALARFSKPELKLILRFFSEANAPLSWSGRNAASAGMGKGQR